MQPKTLDTPQRRRELQRLVHNEFPGCSVVFVTPPAGGIAFRIRATNGRYRSGVLKLLSHHGHVRLNRSWLAEQMKVQGGPAAA